MEWNSRVFSYATGISATGLIGWNIFEEATPGLYIAACILLLLVALSGFVTFSVQKLFYW